MGMGLSGLAFVGSDIGGFAEVPSAELGISLAPDRGLLPVHAHAHHVRHPRPGALVVRYFFTKH